MSTMVRASGGYSSANVEQARQEGYNAGVAATKVGTAQNDDVLSGRTYTNSSAVGAQGSMPDRRGTNIVLLGRTETAVLAKGYYEGNQISVVAPSVSSIKTLTASQRGNVDLTPYDYKYVNADALYTAGYNAGMTYDGDNLISDIIYIGAESIDKDAATSLKTIDMPSHYYVSTRCIIITANCSTTNGYANPIIEGYYNGSFINPSDEDTAQYKSTNIYQKIKTCKYIVGAGTFRFRIISGDHSSNTSYTAAYAKGY